MPKSQTKCKYNQNKGTKIIHIKSHFINIIDTFKIKLKLKVYYIELLKHLKFKTKFAAQEHGGGGGKLNQWRKLMGRKGEGRGKEKEMLRGGGGTRVRFVSRVKQTLTVNLTPKQTNLALRQTVFFCSALPSLLTVHTNPEFLK